MYDYVSQQMCTTDKYKRLQILKECLLPVINIIPQTLQIQKLGHFHPTPLLYTLAEYYKHQTMV